jgi:hypothetical protein
MKKERKKRKPKKEVSVTVKTLNDMFKEQYGSLIDNIIRSQDLFGKAVFKIRSSKEMFDEELDKL